ncbi:MULTISPECIES: DUF4376 domain-containing protein [unclassified Pseudoalteromonas]|uniref:DUF4376 domain-containing protein n=1 Tax=unclassified Pseudoalteromonas TaxID=194690 RepID=UPI00110B9116|nr:MULTISPECIES: DUF4376 domain-containing protein [unclassified Pseudoalteromonas]TMP46670.1 hypothetical protein CWB80_09630 [Pseudoalteromonas sp. S1650]TMP68347.1 hypothetical protein CWB79_05915 [Pseudoalteromonas sp. S1649]
MTNKFEPILDFIVIDDEQNPVTNEQGLPILLQGPIGAKSIPDLIAKGKVENLTMFAELQSKTEQWEWAYKYYDYLVELNEVEQYNANLPEPVASEDGTLVEVEPKALPTEPERPALKTVDEVLEPYKVTIFKLQRQSQIDNAVVEISTGKTFDADELSITRMANALIKHWQLGEDDTIPWSTADVATGVMVECTKAEIIEAHSLATDHFATAWNID